ncbi:MAG: CDP-diacylglycerol--glycerol-3-phosphate 3-phosphatidyltransferase [Treponema sp.]|jgi:CDP-diacylglycerol--glycerol-3-phosphate 3-phosphatidyltransferase|nr:CDP-diacylglycerol--glycerol-3-phosphate 3-phosphatidyltransferase [Treponema sp.]
MRVADKISAVRIVLAPIFCIVYLLPGSGSAPGAPWTVPVLWIIFIVSELTDMLDGMAARRLGEVSDFGKLFDPFADTLVQLSYFLCFVLEGILPVFLFLVVLYREFGVLFLRNLMLRKGVAQGARMGGKIKTVSYIAAGAAALAASSLRRLGFPWETERVFFILSRAAPVLFAVSVFFAALSFADYVRVYRHGA